MRKIKVKSPDRSDLVVFETNAVTKSDLLAQLSNVGISTNNINLVDYHSDVTYELDQAVLPAIDCLLLIVPTKTSQGALDYTIEELSEMGYNELRSYGSKLNKAGTKIDLSGKRGDILERLIAYTYETKEEDAETDDIVYIPISRAALLQVLGPKEVPEINYAIDPITYDQLEAKYNSVLEATKFVKK